MSPFSKYMAELRKSKNLKQRELAERMGYEQSYVSGLETGSKGPPTKEFLEKFSGIFCLNEEEVALIRHAAKISDRKVLIPAHADARIYELFHELRERIHQLLPCQVELILSVLQIPDRLRHEAGALASIDNGKSDKQLKKEEQKM